MRYALILLPLVLLACARPDDLSRWAPESGAVSRAREAMLGMDEADVRMCAGFPTDQISIPGRGTIWTYDLSRARGNFNLNLPTVATGPLQGSAGALGVNSAGSCSAQIRFVNGRVIQMEFSGDNNTFRTINGVCKPIVDGCVSYAEHARGTLPPSPDLTVTRPKFHGIVRNDD